MARTKFQTLTEQMFYILMCLREECCGMDIMGRVQAMTNGRVNVGPGTLYNLLEQFATEGMIRETKVEGRRRSYILTEHGREVLETEYQRLCTQVMDYQRFLLQEVRYETEETQAGDVFAVQRQRSGEASGRTGGEGLDARKDWFDSLDLSTRRIAGAEI